MIRILLVEDQVIMRDALKDSLSHVDDFEVVSAISDAALAPVSCEKLKPDICLMDICTENDSSGIDACGIIKKNCRDSRVIMMTGLPEVSFLERSKLAGADAFIYKNLPLNELISTIRQVNCGYTTFPGPDRNESNDFINDIGGLTNREKDILKMVCNGLTRSEIAEKLDIKESSVKTHFANLLSKTGFPSISKLAIYAVSNGYVNPKI